MIELLQKLISTGFFASLAASAAWDGFKTMTHVFLESHTEEDKTWNALCASLERFYEVNGWDYDESIVIPTFVEGINLFDNLKWQMRDILEYATGGRFLSDRQFKQWVEFFQLEREQTTVELQGDQLPFSDREIMLLEIQHKLCDQATVSTYGDFSKIIQNVIEEFNRSWKIEILKVIDQHDYDESLADRVSFVHSANRCEHILQEMHYLYKKCKWDDGEKNTLKRFLDYPWFNKVLLISGTSGSGKSHFVRQYIKYVAENGVFELTVPCYVNIQELSNLKEDIISSLRQFLTIELPLLSEYLNLLDALHIKICFILENINSILEDKDGWKIVTETIRDLSRYEQFRFIITINEYEYFQVESDQEFLAQYCLDAWKNDSSSIFNPRVLSIDCMNQEMKIVSTILQTGFDINDHIKSLNTPLEAIYFGECVADAREKGDKTVSPPSSYFGYIEKIYKWKREQLHKMGDPDPRPILNVIMNQKCAVIATELNVNPFRATQLLVIRTHHDSLFDKTKDYQLSFYPYWAVGIVCHDPDHLQDYPDEMKEWLLSCFIFRELEKEGRGKIPDYTRVFEFLHEQELLEYALFLSGRGSNRYKRELYNFILEEKPLISTPKICFAILGFIQNHSLSTVERFKLCVYVADAVCDYKLLEIYKRVLNGILNDVSSSDELVDGMIVLANCDNNTINHINGYAVGKKLTDKTEDNTIGDFTHSMIQLLLSTTELQANIKTNSNRTFFDFFARKGYEFYIGLNNIGLRSLYNEMMPFFKTPKPIGAFIKRNFTCAAGNLFEKRVNQKYRKDYIETVRWFAGSKDATKKESACFMILNSVGDDNEKLSPELREVANCLIADPKVRKHAHKLRVLLAGERKFEGY